MNLPQIQLRGGNTHGVRWWAFGIIAHPGWYIGAAVAVLLYVAL